MKSETRNLGAATTGTLVGNVLSLALPFFITAWIQSGETTDAFFYALGAILFLNVTLSVAVEAATTPYLMNIIAHGLGDARRAARRVQIEGALACGTLVLIGVSTVCFLILPQTSFSELQQAEVRSIMLALSPLPILIAWNAVSAGACYAVSAFGGATSSVALRTVFAVAFGFALRDNMPIAGVAAGLIVGELTRLAILEWSVRRLIPVRTGEEPRSQSGNQKSFWRSAAPQVASTSLGSLSPMVDKTFAIALGAGAVTTLELSQRLVYAPILLALSGVGLVLGSRWAGYIANAQWRAVTAEYRRVTRLALVAGVTVVALSVPLAFLLRPAAQDFLAIEDPDLLAWTFSAAALGIPCAIASQVSVRVLLAARETSAMPYLTVTLVALNLGLDFALMKVMGLPGIALASAVVNVATFVFYGIVVHRLLRRQAVKTDVPTFRSADDVIRGGK